MLSTEYLYGVRPESFKDMSYKKALEYKKEAGHKLYVYLYMNVEDSDEYREKVFHVEKALSHTRKLLEELDGTE